MLHRGHVADLIRIRLPMKEAGVRSTVPTGDESSIGRAEKQIHCREEVRTRGNVRCFTRLFTDRRRQMSPHYLQAEIRIGGLFNNVTEVDDATRTTQTEFVRTHRIPRQTVDVGARRFILPREHVRVIVRGPQSELRFPIVTDRDEKTIVSTEEIDVRESHISIVSPTGRRDRKSVV